MKLGSSQNKDGKFASKINLVVEIFYYPDF